MFCKWCGADLPDSASKCARCGKEIPALSDCGGFYDLAPNARRQTAEVPVSTPAVVPVNATPAKMNTPEKDMPAKGKKRGKTRNGLRLSVMLVGFFVVIVLLLGMNRKLGKVFDAAANNEGQIITLHEELEQIKNSIAKEENDTPTLPTEEEPVPDNTPLEAQNAKVEIVADHSTAGVSVKTKAELGDFEMPIATQVILDSATQALSGVQLDLGETEDCIEVVITGKSAASAYGNGSISVDFIIDENLFAKAQNVEYEWTYRTPGSTKWTSLDETVFAVSEDGKTVTYSANKLENILGNAKTAELRLTYKRTNIKGGSLTIMISGITVTNQSVEMKLAVP